MKAAKGVVFVLILLLMLAYVGFRILFRPNTRFFVKDNIILSARYDREEKEFGRFYITRIGNFWAQKDPKNTNSRYVLSMDSLYKGTPPLFFRWKSGFFVEISSEEAANKILYHPDSKLLSPYSNLPEGVLRVDLPPRQFFIMDDRVVRVTNSGGDLTVPEIEISVDGKVYYQLPLSEKEAIAVFGTPDRLFNEFIP